MKRFLAIGGVLATLGFTACNEKTTPITGTDKVLVSDGDGDVDFRQIIQACYAHGQTVKSWQTVNHGDDEHEAVVTCQPKQ